MLSVFFMRVGQRKPQTCNLIPEQRAKGIAIASMDFRAVEMARSAVGKGLVSGLSLRAHTNRATTAYRGSSVSRTAGIGTSQHLPTSHLSNLVLCVALELQRLIIEDVSQFWHSPSLDPLQPVFQGLSFSAEFSPLQMRPHASALGLGLRAPAT